MAAVAERGHADILSDTVLAPDPVSVTMPFYLLNSRYKLDSSLSLKAHLGNKYLLIGIRAVVVLQLLFTYAPRFQTLFAGTGDGSRTAQRSFASARSNAGQCPKPAILGARHPHRKMRRAWPPSAARGAPVSPSEPLADGHL
jgi:hypothetical protein